MKKILIIIAAGIATIGLTMYGTYTVMKSNKEQEKSFAVEVKKKFEVCGVKNCYQTDTIQQDNNLGGCFVIDGAREICGALEIKQN